MHPFTPIKFIRPTRADRDLNRGREAGARVKAAGGSAMDAAKAMIEATFNGSATHNAAMRRVERFIELGAAATETRCRFGDLARAFLRTVDPQDADLDWAIGVLDRSWHENRARIDRHRFPRDGGYRSLGALADARLILRWLRATHRAHLWPMVLETAGELAAPDTRPTMRVTKLTLNKAGGLSSASEWKPLATAEGK